jgi:hypothetical protein
MMAKREKKVIDIFLMKISAATDRNRAHEKRKTSQVRSRQNSLGQKQANKAKKEQPINFFARTASI